MRETSRANTQNTTRNTDLQTIRTAPMAASSTVSLTSADVVSDDDAPLLTVVRRHNPIKSPRRSRPVSSDDEGSFDEKPIQTWIDEENQIRYDVEHLNDVFEQIRAKCGLENVYLGSSEDESSSSDSGEGDDENDDSSSGASSSSDFEPPVKRMKTAKSEPGESSDSSMDSDAASASTVKLKWEVKDELSSEWTTTSSSSDSGESLTDQPCINYDPAQEREPYENPNAELLGVSKHHVPAGYMLPHQLFGRFEAAQVFRNLTKRQLKEEREYFLNTYLKKEEESSSASSGSDHEVKAEVKAEVKDEVKDEAYDSDAEYKPYRYEPDLNTKMPQLTNKQIDHHKGLSDEHRKILRVAWTKPHLLPIRIAEVFEVDQEHQPCLNGIYRIQRGVCLNGRPVYYRESDTSRQDNSPKCMCFAKNRWRILNELDETSVCWAMKWREQTYDDYSSYAPYHYPANFQIMGFKFQSDDELKFGPPIGIFKDVGGKHEVFKPYWQDWIEDWEVEREGWDEQKGKTKTDLENLPSWFKLGFRNQQHYETSNFCTRAAMYWAKRCKEMHSKGEGVSMDNPCCFPGFFINQEDQWKTITEPGTTTPIPCIYRLDGRGRFFYFKFSRQFLIAGKERIQQNRLLKPIQHFIMSVKQELDLEDRVGPKLYYDKIFDPIRKCVRRMNEDEIDKRKKAEIEERQKKRALGREEREAKERLVKLEQNELEVLGPGVKSAVYVGQGDTQGRFTEGKVSRRIQAVQSGLAGVTWYQQEKKAMAKGIDPRNTHKWVVRWYENGKRKIEYFPLRHPRCLDRGDYRATKKCALTLALRKRRQMVALAHVKQKNRYGQACEVQSGVKGVNWNKRDKLWNAALIIGNINNKETYKHLQKNFKPKNFIEKEDESPLDPGPVSRAKEAAIAQRREWESEHFAFDVTKTLVAKELFNEPLNPLRAACSVQSGITGVSWNARYEVWLARFKPKNKKTLQKTFSPKQHMQANDASHLDPRPMNLAKKEAIKQREEWEKQFAA